MSVTLFVLNLLPKFNVVIACFPVSPNIHTISVTLLVSKLLPKSSFVIDLHPVIQNIPRILVTLLTFNKFKFFIVSFEVHLSEKPTK